MSKSTGIGALTCLVLIIITSYVSYYVYQLNRAYEKERLTAIANVVKNNMEVQLYNSSSVNYTLAYLINEYDTLKDFDRIAEQFITANKNIAAIEILDSGTITQIYPLKNNEQALGYNILADASRSQEAYKAIEKRELYFAGPLQLKQGGEAVVGRLPIFKNGVFKGFSAVIIHADKLLKTAGIYAQNDSEIIYQLSKINPQTGREEFLIKGAPAFSKHQGVSVDIPVGEWKLYVMPRVNSPFNAFVLTLVFGILFSAMAGIFVGFILQQPFKLKKLVDEKVSLLHQNEKMLLETQRVAKIGSWQMDVASQAVTWSETLNEIFELPAGSQRDFNYVVSTVKDADRGAIFFSTVEEVKKGREYFDLSLQVVTGKGNIKWIRITGKAEAPGGKASVYGIIQDIDDSKTIEEERKDILESITDAFIAIDTQWKITYLNKAAHEMFGVRVHDIISPQTYPQEEGEPENPFYLYCMLAMEKQEPYFFEYFSKMSQRWLATSVYPKHNGLTVYFRDVTEKKQYLKAIEGQNMLLKEIAWTQSHEVRAPLARLLGLVSLLENIDQIDLTKEFVIEHIRRSANELDEMIISIAKTTYQANVDLSKQK